MTTQFRAQGKSAEIWLYDQVGKSFWGEGISAKDFQKELSALGKVSLINLRINSPGGDVFDGFAIYNQLRSHPARIVVDIDGVAASISSIIAMSGDEIRMASNAMMMIHNPHGMAIGDSAEMKRVAALLDQIKLNLAKTYAEKTGHNAHDIGLLMDDETWMDAEAAIASGFVDSITSEQKVSACYDMSAVYSKAPKLKSHQHKHASSEHDIAVVRLSQQAKRLLAIASV